MEARLSRRDAVTLLAPLLALALLAWWLPDVSFERRLRLENARLAPAGGHAFRIDVELPTPADRRDKAKSYLRLLEDGAEQGPAHELPRQIELAGGGAFRHERDHVLLSSSDGTDPRENGRAYELVWPGHVPFPLQYLAVAGFAAFALGALPFAASRSGASARARRALAVGGAALALGFALECAAKVVTAQILLEDEGLFARNVYRQAFGGDTGPDAGGAGGEPDGGAGGETGAYVPAFSPHAYLPYALEPLRASRGVRETNAEFLIRRSEPIRPRDEVALRILALGGSTTHDEKIAAESLTWVYQLEKLLRARHGPALDVINGGVGGYTLYENAVHYLMLLTHLEPDVVLVFQGINDVNPRLFRNRRYDYGDYNLAWWDPREATIEPASGPLARSHAGRLWLWLTHYQHVSQQNIHGLTRKPYPPEAEWPQNLRDTPPDLYARMLENLALLVRAQGRQMVVVPQPFRALTPQDELFAAGLAAQNDANRDVAQRLGLPFLPLERLDAAFRPGDFVDNCHFSPAGAERMAAALAEFLEARGMLARATASETAPRMSSETVPPR